MGQDRSGQITNRSIDCAQAVAAIPEAVVGGLVPKDKHQAHDDGEGRNLEIAGDIGELNSSCRSECPLAD